MSVGGTRDERAAVSRGPRLPGRRRLLGAAGALALPLAGCAGGRDGAPPSARVLRYAFPAAETGFDPVQLSDLYSRIVTAHIFEAPLAYDYLARPFKLKPNTAAALPQVSADATRFTVRIRPGIFFADDPAFGGRRRELVAADYLYQYRRVFDPRWKAPYVATWMLYKVAGLNAYRDQVLKRRKPFDYDRPIEGLRLLDRYTFEIRLEEPDPRFIYALAAGDIYGAVAREVVEHYGDRIMAHPVGTGPFVLAEWRRSSRIVLVRNPGFRELRYAAEPNADDREGQALLRRYRGQRLPLVDRVEVSIIDEGQPRYLAFANGEHDVLYGAPLEFVNLIAPGGQLAPHLRRRGVRLHRVPAADVTMTIYNMEHPLVGGYTPEKVALRRAINLGTDVRKEIRLVRRDQAIVAQSPLMPMTYGYDAEFRCEMGEYDTARARALLDMFGYLDRNGDGWREQPDGSPLVLEVGTLPDQLYRQLDEVRRTSMAQLGLQVQFRAAQWPEQLKRARAGKFMIWTVGLSAADPDGQPALALGYGPDTGGQNLSRFRLAEFDRAYERAKTLPDGPERLEQFLRAKKLLAAYAPYKFHVHRILTDLTQPWITGFRRPPFWLDWWQYVDVDAGPQARAPA
jgi:ABC-type transport system substrate-binding protein